MGPQDEEYITCPTCDGECYLEVEYERCASYSRPYGYIETRSEECQTCEGSGEILNPLYESEE